MGDEDYASLILPILASPEWTERFGKEHAGRWLELCNRMLDRGLSLDRFSLQQLVQELETLAPKPPIGKGPILALAGAAAVLVVVGVLVAMYFKRGHLLITTDPPGAEIKIEVQGQYRSFGKTPPDKSPLRVTLHKGAYMLQAEYPGLTNQLGQVEIEGGKSVPYQLAFPCGQVHISTDTSGATVERNGSA